MKLEFDAMDWVTIPHLNGGEGSVSAKMFGDAAGKIMVSRLPAGASIGLHRHEDSSEINYVLAGTGKTVCGKEEESMEPGSCHYCPKGEEHSIQNTGAEDLVLFTVVPRQ